MRKAILRALLAVAAVSVAACTGSNTLTSTSSDGTTGGTTAGTSTGTTAGNSTGSGTGTGTTGATGTTVSANVGSIGSGTGTTGVASTSTTGSGGSTATTGVGPWPNAQLTQYGAANGITEEIVDVSVDEGENLWAVSHAALYLLKPGETTFHRFTGADGLNLANAAAPGIMNVAGGKAGEVFVGYNGEDVNGLPQANGDAAHDAVLKKGGVDHVTLNANGTLTVDHPEIHSDDYVVTTNGQTETDYSFYEDRGTRRMLYDHRFHPGTLYVGWNHGVNRIDWGRSDAVTHFTYADHVHPIVTSTNNGNTTEWMGEWRGLALDPTKDGMLWLGGQYTGGAINWTPELYDWTCQRTDCPHGANSFTHAWAKAWGAPLFPVANDGDSMNIRAAAVTADGTTYFASGPQWNPGVDKVYGVAVVKAGAVTYLDPVGDMHLPSNQLMDMVAMPDGTLAVAVMDGGLWRYNPATGQTTQLAGVPGHINMLYLDTLVKPAALYAATDQGFSVVRDTP